MAIKVQDVTVEFKGTQALSGVSCTIPQGAVVGLLGPSGAGKTTLIRVIMGAQKVTRGMVTVLDMPAGKPALRQRIGYMAQLPSVYADLTVIENVRYFCRILRLPGAEAERVLERVDLAPQRVQIAATLSGGQRSRLSLAVALLGTPPVLVLDEPTVGLDPLLRQKLWQLFAQLAAAGCTLLISSHVMDEAVRCDQLILLRGGAVVAQGSVKSLLEKSKTNNLEAAFIALAKQKDGDV